MLNKPDIKRAIPQRRYKFGEFTLVVLGDVESGDSLTYHYILAVVRDGDAEPGIYLTAEAGAAGTVQLRLVMRDGNEVIAEDPGLGDIEVFSATGIDMLRQILNLGDEEAYRLL
ncbi:MAG: hypothetical protein WCZ87_01515 [Thiohalobacteraceae bacterium]